MRPAFGVLRHVERRESNPTVTKQSAQMITETRTQYQIMVTRVVLFWVTVWKHETDWA